MDQLIQQTFSADAAVRRAAEEKIRELQRQPGFGQLALGLACNEGADQSVRLGAAVSFKNWINKGWVVSLFSTTRSDPWRTLRDVERASGACPSRGGVPLYAEASRSRGVGWNADIVPQEEEAEVPISVDERNALKEQIVPTYIERLGSRPALQVQVGEAISTMAKSDFPDSWPGLLDQLVSFMSAEDFTRNNGVLEIVHSVFRTCVGYASVIPRGLSF
jgi:exportin-2 (importin alpha re-exporter)